MERSAAEKIEHAIGDCVASKNWKKVIDLGQALPIDKRVKFLWVWPRQQDLHRIRIGLNDLNISRVISIGCGTGLLEWLITRATGVAVAGVEKDENWWRSKYATKTYIPMMFAEGLSNVIDGQGQLRWHAMMFCYFNDGGAFREYVQEFGGSFVIIIGPAEGRGVHTDPLPFQPNFPAEQNWERVQSFKVGSENLNHLVIYQRQ
ncbi:uncharacterized protein LOC129771921 [Toxorhynchites rutilus septentrionalis]|uniref:uncharacterized protein LOC129771921 n=1 Tax=Toxorhynchites rutilus septentrionalis TaxID=329112 RepID=UPI00247922A6|nr:uncharacterized protein LOC129771921 [Toxorhynchites rutilus septentrionalis]